MDLHQLINEGKLKEFKEKMVKCNPANKDKIPF